jgi:hypothetical protein
MTQTLHRHQPITTVEDLLNLHDESFVHNAYLCVLRRPADPGGFASYLKQLRQGTDKEQLLAALATSTEGTCVSTEALPGLPQVVESAVRNRPPLWLRVVRRLLAQALKPVLNQLHTSNQRLHELNTNTQARFDRLEAALVKFEGSTTVTTDGSFEAVTTEERQELQQMSEHAREVYFQLKDAIAHKKRVSLQ